MNRVTDIFNYYYRVQTAKEEDQVTYRDDMVDFDADFDEFDDIGSIPTTNFLTANNDIYGSAMKQIKSQTYSTSQLATLFAKNFNNQPSEASESTNANSTKRR